MPLEPRDNRFVLKCGSCGEELRSRAAGRRSPKPRPPAET
jgi:hypothetical protein